MDERLARTVDVLAGFVNRGGDLEETLSALLGIGADVIGAELASLTIRDQHGRPTSAVLTTPTVLPLDEVQYDHDSGPCLDAARLHTVFRVDDTEADQRWPEYASVAAARGVFSSLSVPLVIGGESVGSANFYDSGLGYFTPDRVRSAEVVTSQCSIAAQYWTVARERTTLAAALESRATIEQAKGVIMATTGCTPDDAFDLLRDQSQNENRKLREIAAEVVARQKR
ncbi:MAG TPA: GAF and ANTAR domain-containing protein [Acidimicrobiales bacterium]|nr:GAF and ANTAR domain-containing protein [Acidimicrobiales bacterium]